MTPQSASLKKPLALARRTRPKTQAPPENARDRLLSALGEAPRLTKRDATRINQAVQQAREASLGDDLSP